MCSACFLYRTEILNSIQVDGSPVRNVRRVDGNRSKSDSDFEDSHFVLFTKRERKGGLDVPYTFLS